MKIFQHTASGDYSTMASKHPLKYRIMQRILHPLVWFSRTWCQTSRGTWHISSLIGKKRWEGGAYFKPACIPSEAWKVTNTARRSTPKSGRVCKVCALLRDWGWY